MGKRRGGGGGGGAHKGRGEDVTSARGHGCVIATCNVAREREGSRELVTLLTQMIERVYPDQEREEEGEEEGEEGLSAEELMRREIEGLKAKTSSTQAVVSLQTGVKGVVFVKIRRHHICPVRLVRALFAQVAADGLPLSRHLVRVVPLQRVFFPDEQELTTHVRALVGLPALVAEGNQVRKVGSGEVENVGGGETSGANEGNQKDEKDGVAEKEEDEDEGEEGGRANKRSRVDVEHLNEPTVHCANDSSDGVSDGTKLTPSAPNSVAVIPPRAGPALTYNLSIKIRNHDTLKKLFITQCVTSNLPRHRFQYNYKEFKGMFVVNIFKNIAGISLVEDYGDMLDFNIAKHQEKHAPSPADEKRLIEGEAGKQV